MGLHDNSCNSNDSDELREDLVKTAVKFLQNPKVVNTPLVQKQRFLQRKGLTDKEVQVACEQSGAYDQDLPSELIPIAQLQPPQEVNYLELFKKVAQGVTILSALVYGSYILYKNVIEPLLFKNKKSAFDEKMELFSKNLQSCIQEQLGEMKEDLERQIHSKNSNTLRQIQDIKAEITSVKGLLLNRKQFPTVGSGPVVPPSIPAWQLSSLPTDPAENTDKNEELMEIGSGSGSSDREQEQSTTKSDSSIEIM